MRSGPTQMRGPFALIREGTNTISGVATLAGVGWTMPLRHLLETRHLHRIPTDMLRPEAAEKWNTPWILTNVRRLVAPVPCDYPSDAVDWVNLHEEVSRKIAIQLDDAVHAGSRVPTRH
ncbi:hypothetical protein C2U70_30215 [Bradyrhizobium guangdongense]|nr:hypothetical protein C2U70_30215 [Bradyrhizobium guangdongense]